MKKQISKEPQVLDLTRINFSMISMYLKCPRQFHFRYVLGRKEPPKISMIEGSAHHEALEMNNLHKKKRGFDLQAGTVTEKFMESLRTRTKEVEKLDWEDESEDGLFVRGKVWHKDYFFTFAPKIVPDIVEEKFEKEVKLNGSPVIVSGIIDLGYGNKVSDYKTTSSFGLSQKKRFIGSDLQLSFYSWAANRPEVEQICFVKASNPKVEAIPSARSKREIAWALKVAGQMMEAVKKESFPMCDPASWFCSGDYCGYWRFCRGK